MKRFRMEGKDGVCKISAFWKISESRITAFPSLRSPRGQRLVTKDISAPDGWWHRRGWLCSLYRRVSLQVSHCVLFSQHSGSFWPILRALQAPRVELMRSSCVTEGAFRGAGQLHVYCPVLVKACACLTSYTHAFRWSTIGRHEVTPGRCSWGSETCWAALHDLHWTFCSKCLFCMWTWTLFLPLWKSTEPALHVARLWLHVKPHVSSTSKKVFALTLLIHSHKDGWSECSCQ